jgi:hypothetical protein
MRQPIDVNLHVMNVLAGGETINIDNNTLTRQQDRVFSNKIKRTRWKAIYG